MTEHESRKCNERRSGFVLSSLINIKAAFVENGIIKTKISITCQAKGIQWHVFFRKQILVSEIPKE